ncbi:MAG: hypothetical protein WAU36_00850 [Cyclobacteriaceae bacterium]
MKKIAAVLLIVLALVMFYLSYTMDGLPPAITGIGFLIIAMVFIKED